MRTINHNRPIGIIGGMGPDASARLYTQMIEMARVEFGVTENHRYPEIVIDLVPVPEFFSQTDNLDQALKMLKDRVKRLSGYSLSSLAVACNTAHIILEELEKANGSKMVSIPEEVVKEAKKRGYQKVGLLASPTTILSGVYQTEFLDKKIEVEMPENGYIEELGEIISRVVGGELVRARRELIKIANKLKQKEVEAIVLGCTELPLVFPKEFDLPVLDSVEILARSLLNRYYRRRQI